MALVDTNGTPIQPKLEQSQIMQLMTGLRIRIDAANAQLVQLGLLVEYLYEELGKADIKINMDVFPQWAEKRYTEIQKQAKEAVAQSKGEVDKIKESLKEELDTAKQMITNKLEKDDNETTSETTEEAPEKVATEVEESN